MQHLVVHLFDPEVRILGELIVDEVADLAVEAAPLALVAIAELEGDVLDGADGAPTRLRLGSRVIQAYRVGQ